MSESKPAIHEVLAAVMGDVRAVGKTGRNSAQNYNFRGIDEVMNAVGPVLRQHGVVVLPTVLEHTHETVTSANGKPMGHVMVKVAYTFTGPAGDSMTCTVLGEAMDYGDKTTAKAMSVAFRTALLQSLTLPTTETDPDAESFERAEAPKRARQAKPRQESGVDDIRVPEIVQEFGMVNTEESLRVLSETVSAMTISDDNRDLLRGAYKAAKQRLETPETV